MSPNFNPHQPRRAFDSSTNTPSSIGGVKPQPPKVTAAQQPSGLVNNDDKPGPQPIPDAKTPERTLYARDDFSATPNPASAFGSTMPDPFHRDQNASQAPPPAAPTYPVASAPNQPIVVPDKFASQEMDLEAARNGHVQQYAPTQIYTGQYSQMIDPAATAAGQVASAPNPTPQPLNVAGDPYTGQYSQMEMTLEAKNYLNQITPAPTPKKSGLAGFLSGKVLWVALAGVAAIILFIAAAIFNNANSPNTDYKIASAKLTNLQAMVDYGVKNDDNLDATTLRTATELNAILLSRTPDFTTVMTAAGVKAPDKKFIATQTDATTITNLDSAKASGTLGPAYTAALDKSIDETMAALDTLYKAKVGQKTRDELLKIYTQLNEEKSRLPEETAAQ